MCCEQESSHGVAAAGEPFERCERACNSAAAGIEFSPHLDAVALIRPNHEHPVPGLEGVATLFVSFHRLHTPNLASAKECRGLEIAGPASSNVDQRFPPPNAGRACATLTVRTSRTVAPSLAMDGTARRASTTAKPSLVRAKPTAAALCRKIELMHLLTRTKRLSGRRLPDCRCASDILPGIAAVVRFAGCAHSRSGREANLGRLANKACASRSLHSVGATRKPHASPWRPHWASPPRLARSLPISGKPFAVPANPPR